MKERFKNKLILIDDNVYQEFKKTAKFYGIEIPFAFNEAMRLYIEKKQKDIIKQNEKFEK